MKLQCREILTVYMLLAVPRVFCSSGTRYKQAGVLLEESIPPYYSQWNPSESKVIKDLRHKDTIYIRNVGERCVSRRTLPENINSILILDNSRIDYIANGFFFYREHRKQGPTYIINPNEEVPQTEVLLNRRNMDIRSMRKLQDRISKCREQYPRYFTQTKKYLERVVEIFRLVLYKREILKAKGTSKLAHLNLKNLIKNMYLKAGLLRKKNIFEESINIYDINAFIVDISILDKKIRKNEREIEDLNTQSMLGWLYKMDSDLASFMLELYPEINPEELLRESTRKIEAAFTRNEDSLYKAVVDESKVDFWLLYTAGEIYTLIKNIEYLGIAMGICTEIWESTVIIVSYGMVDSETILADLYHKGLTLNIYLTEEDIKTIIRAKEFSDIKHFADEMLKSKNYNMLEKLILNDSKSLRRNSV